MFLRIFGRDEEEQARGLIGFGFVVSVLTFVFMIVVQPEYGSQPSPRTLNMDIISSVVALVTLFAGYLAGSMKRKAAKRSEDDDGS